MRICRFAKSGSDARLAAVNADSRVYELPYACFIELVRDAKAVGKTSFKRVRDLIAKLRPLDATLEDLPLLVPVQAPEVWAAGVTYMRSREARNYESTGGDAQALTIYDKVYEASRPEVFFKSTAARLVGPNGDVCLRSDSDWQIPEPELGLVLDSGGQILGYTIGNDMSCRDIEGENPLYLPQAKIWKGSCSIGPAIALPESVPDAYGMDIRMTISRKDHEIFAGRANTRQLKRRYDELVACLMKDNLVVDGTVLLTGTCIVPPDDFTLCAGDRIDIEIPGIGTLSNRVMAQ
jgi:2-dehydro-3-deoxy-D-arabinonate dehydratase